MVRGNRILMKDFSRFSVKNPAGIGRAKAPQAAAKRKRGGGMPAAGARPLKRHFAEAGRGHAHLRQALHGSTLLRGI